LREFRGRGCAKREPRNPKTVMRRTLGVVCCRGEKVGRWGVVGSR
jgi:hypothetical protein